MHCLQHCLSLKIWLLFQIKYSEKNAFNVGHQIPVKTFSHKNGWFFASAAKAKHYFDEIQSSEDALERSVSPGTKISILTKVDISRIFIDRQYVLSC